MVGTLFYTTVKVVNSTLEKIECDVKLAVDSLVKIRFKLLILFFYIKYSIGNTY